MMQITKKYGPEIAKNMNKSLTEMRMPVSMQGINHYVEKLLEAAEENIINKATD